MNRSTRRRYWIPVFSALFAVTSSLGVSSGAGTISEEEVIMLPGDVPLVMVWIPGGTFMMGRYPGEQDSMDWEDPQHEVTVPGFWMGKYPVTQAQWQALMGTNTSLFPRDSWALGSNRPAEGISWFCAAEFIRDLNSHTGLTFRLPSEAEWEYACRAGTTTRFYWGDDPEYTQISDYAWWRGNSDGETHDVGQKIPNAFGLYDMSGNVWEWCEDDWNGSYADAPSDGSALIHDLRERHPRVSRGGGGRSSGIVCRSAYRTYASYTYNYCFQGFRVSR